MFAGINPYAWLIAGGIWISSTLGAYFYGHNEGWNAALAQQAVGIQKSLADFENRVGTTATAATAAALAEFKLKTGILADVGAQLAKQQGAADAAASQLSISLAGSSCKLQPAQRRLLECVRNPAAAGCSPSPAPLRSAVSGKGSGP